MPSAADFKLRLDLIFSLAQQNGLAEVEVSSEDLHRRVGGYPGQDHRMPLCCQVMTQYFKEKAGDHIVDASPSGQVATLRIRYILPRPTQ